MGRGKRLSAEEIGRIKALHEEGYSNRNIAGRINRSSRVVNNFVRNMENYGKNYRGGIQTATTERERRNILREASNSCCTARKIKQAVQSTASLRTVQRIIKKCAHLKRRRLQKKPVLTQRHKENRLNFARNHMGWTDQWQTVIFTDEKRFCLDGPDGYLYYFHDLRKEEKFVARHHNREAGIMVWGAISSNGVVHLEILNGIQNARKYRDLLLRVKPIINRTMGGLPWIFQHDHAAIHTARIISTWFEDQNIEVLEWPSVSPDLNIIENVWGWLTRRLYGDGQQYQNTVQLSNAIEAAWNVISQEYLNSLFNSLPNRIFEVIRKGGSHTHY